MSFQVGEEVIVRGQPATVMASKMIGGHEILQVVLHVAQVVWVPVNAINVQPAGQPIPAAIPAATSAPASSPTPDTPTSVRGAMPPPAKGK